MPALTRDESLSEKFRALIAERRKTWDPGRLARNEADRRELVDRFEPLDTAQPGERLEPFVLQEVGGGELGLDALVEHGPAVLLFFRFGECPACNIALPHYDRHLRPSLEAEGIALLAVSPQLDDRLAGFRQKLDLRLRIASDPDNRLARRLGITFTPGIIPPGPPPAGWIGEVTGTGTWELPQPTVVVLDQARTVRSITVSPDWLDRPEAADIVRSARAALAASPA